jgi:hypothetical protein
MHLVSAQRLARLKSNKRAFDHFEKHKQLFVAFARNVRVFAAQYPELSKDETRVPIVAAYIYNLDKDIWALKNDTMSAEELAETYARFVVGHEDEKI